jgi:hypothetical protein
MLHQPTDQKHCKTHVQFTQLFPDCKTNVASKLTAFTNNYSLYQNNKENVRLLRPHSNAM